MALAPYPLGMTLQTQPILTAARPLADIGRRFLIHSEFQPAGDQPQAIAELIEGIERGDRDQVLLGVTGSGKTFTMAHVIAGLQRPALILAPNKTLAAQLYGEMKSFFPENAVEYFVSYYDYYQPEAYVPRTDTYIEKESSVNEQIDRMRHAATRAILERRDTVIVASVSCIYGIGSVETYSEMTFELTAGKRRKNGAARERQGLSQQPLRHAEADPAAGDRRDETRSEAARGRIHGPRQAAGGAARRAAHDLRHRDDGGDRELRRDRELLPLSDGPQAR
jgi:hypothetical protein